MTKKTTRKPTRSTRARVEFIAEFIAELENLDLSKPAEPLVATEPHAVKTSWPPVPANFAGCLVGVAAGGAAAAVARMTGAVKITPGGRLFGSKLFG